MKEVLEFLLRHFDYLYRDPQYRITDSRTNGVNASLTLTSPILTWLIANNRGQIQLSVGPTELPENRFWPSLIKQHLEGYHDIEYMPAAIEAEWARDNLREIVRLFSTPPSLEITCAALQDLLRSNAEKQWGPSVTD